MKKNPSLTPEAVIDSSFPAGDTAFINHITELRNRLMRAALVFSIASAAAYNYHSRLLGVIMKPLRGEKLVYLTPGGGFSFVLQISLYAGLIAAAPVIVHQAYGFLRPALPDKAQRSAMAVSVAAAVLLLAGIAYGYFVAVPVALRFLGGFAGDMVIANLTAESYLSFFLSYIAGLGLLFLLPIFLIFWHWASPLSAGKLLRTERWIILLAFVAAAIVTPTPDVANQTMIALPVIALYQLGVIAVLIAIARQKRQAKTMTGFDNPA